MVLPSTKRFMPLGGGIGGGRIGDVPTILRCGADAGGFVTRFVRRLRMRVLLRQLSLFRLHCDDSRRHAAINVLPMLRFFLRFAIPSVPAIATLRW